MTRPDPSQGEVPATAWPALWALVVGFFMILVDSTIVSVATPALIRDFGADVNTVLWVTSAYLLAYAVPLLITGRLGDRIGPKRVYLIGLAIFTLSSLACGLSNGIGVLIAARVVQGLGAAMMTPQTMAVITRTFPPQRRGGAMALWGSVAGLATLVGPLAGGLLIDSLGWEWIFFVNVPVGLVGLVLAWRLVPTLETHAHSFDGVGVVLSAVGLFCFVFGVQEGETYDWGTIVGPLSVPLLIGVGVALMVGFVWWQSRVRREPLVPLGLFRDRNFSIANIGISTVGFAITAMIFPFMIYAQVVRGMTPTQAALLLAPQSLIGLLLAPVAGRLVDRVHPRLLAGIGLAGMALSLYAFALLMRPYTPIWQLLLAAFVMGVTSTLVWGPLSTSANRNLLPQHAGAGSGVYNTTRQVGSVMGSAAIAVLMEARMTALMPGRPAGVGADGALPPAVQGPLAQALAQSMILPASVLVVGWVASLFFENARHLVGPRAAASVPVESTTNR